MGRKKAPRPTKAEMAILYALWELGPSTVRQIWESLEHHQRVGYTTVLKQLQVMQQKGLVTADDRPRSNIYTAAITEEEAQRRGRIELLKEFYRGSARKLMLQAVAEEHLSKEELLEIRRLINSKVK